MRWAWLVLFVAAGAIRAQGFTPEEAVKRMKVPEGFQVKVIAAEPEIRQPVTMTFDDRGRIWVIQYLQYPTPAGLKPVKVDQYLRTEYDRVPEPPPKGPRGADRITILEDPDENGRFRKAKDFVTGLNLASGMALGHGGVFVVQPPYLLFYPDRNGDDVPDGDPEVLLTGFGMEDSHAFANSLQWGPDGWLYGAQGSTVTARIRGIEFQQGIWRYHPITKQFELFSEGGGNTWGLDFDRHGNAIAGTNFGGFAMLHQVQGGYYVKGFAKHGPLHNPHTYGYFDHVPYKNFRGGHVTCGGIVYEGDAYPAEFRGRYIAGNLLSNVVHWHELERQGSSFTARFGGEFLVANDTWFRPIDCLTGPDGSVYIVDWYDKRANHVDPRDTWDRTNGRIYKVEWKGARRETGGARLGARSSAELVAMLGDGNSWRSGEARRILAERRDATVHPLLRQRILDNKGSRALESLWALYTSGGLDDGFALKLFEHPDEDVRTWTVRLLGDAKHVTSAQRDAMAKLAGTDLSPTVRSQLACTSKRLPAADALPIVRELLKRGEDANDPHIPLLLWWAIEDKAIADRDLVIGLVEDPRAWRALLTGHIAERLARRYLAEGSEKDYETCARFLQLAPGAAEQERVLYGMVKALEGRRLSEMPPVLEKALDRLSAPQKDTVLFIVLSLRLGSTTAYERALVKIEDTKGPFGHNPIPLIEAVGQAGRDDCVPVLLRVLATARTNALRGAALAALEPYPDPRIAEAVLAEYRRLPSDLRNRAQSLLCNRPTSALAFLQKVDTGGIASREVPLDRLQKLAQFNQPEIKRLLEKHWGKFGEATPGEKLTRIRNVATALSQGKGDAVAGKVLFTKHCATCHTLFGEGNKIGPDLTSADRKSRDFLIANIVDPSAIIRPEFVAYNVEMKDGRVLNGLVVETTPTTVTLVDAKNERTVLARDRIDKMDPSAVSLMPEKLLDPLEDQEVRDLFSYLQKDGP